jgi:hypothetical protein
MWCWCCGPRRRDYGSRDTRETSPTAIEILKERFAREEIDNAEFEEKRRNQRGVKSDAQNSRRNRQMRSRGSGCIPASATNHGTILGRCRWRTARRRSLTLTPSS